MTQIRLRSLEYFDLKVVVAGLEFLEMGERKVTQYGWGDVFPMGDLIPLRTMGNHQIRLYCRFML